MLLPSLLFLNGWAYEGTQCTQRYISPSKILKITRIHVLLPLSPFTTTTAVLPIYIHKYIPGSRFNHRGNNANDPPPTDTLCTLSKFLLNNFLLFGKLYGQFTCKITISLTWHHTVAYLSGGWEDGWCWIYDVGQTLLNVRSINTRRRWNTRLQAETKDQVMSVDIYSIKLGTAHSIAEWAQIGD